MPDIMRVGRPFCPMRINLRVCSHYWAEELRAVPLGSARTDFLIIEFEDFARRYSCQVGFTETENGDLNRLLAKGSTVVGLAPQNVPSGTTKLHSKNCKLCSAQLNRLRPEPRSRSNAERLGFFLNRCELRYEQASAPEERLQLGNNTSLLSELW